jgi:hypothetical protein
MSEVKQSCEERPCDFIRARDVHKSVKMKMKNGRLFNLSQNH